MNADLSRACDLSYAYAHNVAQAVSGGSGIGCTFAVSAATNKRPAIVVLPRVNGWIGRLSNYPRCQEGQEGILAVNRASHRAILDDTPPDPSFGGKAHHHRCGGGAVGLRRSLTEDEDAVQTLGNTPARS